MIWLLPMFAYLLGSVSSAIVVAKLFGLEDPRRVGSRNPGATNILRYGGKTAAILTLAGDVLKGVIPVALAHALEAEPPVLGVVMLAAFLGHVFPLYHGFRGGKGVATAAGALLALNVWVGVALIVTWLALAFTTRYSSLSAIVATFASPAYVWGFTRDPWLVAATVVMGAMLLWRHRPNIRKLLAGTEPKIGKS